MPVRLTRFSPPVVAEGNIVRHTLIRQLETLPRQCVIYIHAPAGYGKTTLASQWLSETGKSTAWLSLDEYSASPSEIYKGILEALSYQTDTEEDYTQVTLETMLAVLSAAKAWPDALVIDDFQLCADIGVAKVLPLIRARLPSDMSFVVISRNPPHDVLSEQLIKGLVRVITGLQFGDQEISELFKKHKISITSCHAKQLKVQTDGWAAALSAILMANDSESHYGLLNQNTLNHYLKSHVFEFYDDFHILKKCSICDILYPSLCEAITGQTDTWNVIETLANLTGLVMRPNEKSYQFHALLREFLLAELESDTAIDKAALYKNAAAWHIKNGDQVRALHMAAKSGDLAEAEEMTRAVWSKYGVDNLDMNAYVNYVEEHLLTIPKHITEKYPRISIGCFDGAFHCRPINEIHDWLDILEGHMRDGRFRQEDYISAAFHFLLDPRRDSWHVPKQFERISKLVSAPTNQSASVHSLSHNLPFFHKAQRDYTDIASELPAFFAEAETHMKPFFGPAFNPLLMLLESGVCYEKGEFERAEQITMEMVKISKHFPPEIRFCTSALYFEILRLQGKPFDLNQIGSMITETKAIYLAANFSAYEADAHLFEGDKTFAEHWLKQAVANDTLRLYRVPQYFTTARALMVLGRLADALKLLSRLADFSTDYRRGADYIEALTMQAICHWNMSHHDEAVTVMTSAVIKATELRVITSAAKYGTDIMPVLQKILNRLKHGYGADVLDKSFVNEIFIKAKTISQYVCGMLMNSKPKVTTLSPRQKEMLGYLAQNLTYQEISDKTGVKITTVRDHITKLYDKLGVSTATDAVMRATELSL